MKTLVLGLGNTLLSDEGVGVHVLTRLSGYTLPDDVHLLDGGTLSFTLAVPIEEHDALIVVDAANLQDKPGAWQVFEGEEMDTFLTEQRHASVHEVGLGDLRAIAMLAGHWPAHRALVAIQPEKVDWGDVPTQAVAEAMGPACDAIHGLLASWRAGHHAASA
jgi:hydrogenase maturation protease